MPDDIPYDGNSFNITYDPDLDWWSVTDSYSNTWETTAKDIIQVLHLLIGIKI